MLRNGWSLISGGIFDVTLWFVVIFILVAKHTVLATHQQFFCSLLEGSGYKGLIPTQSAIKISSLGWRQDIMPTQNLPVH